MHVILRQSQNRHIARIQSFHITHHELFYLRALLQNQPASSFEDLHTVNGIIHNTFQSTCIAIGIFSDENEADYCLNEAVLTLRTPRQLCILFIHILINKCINIPLHLWTKFLPHFIADYLLNNDNNYVLSIDLALQDLAKYLEEYRKCLTDFGLSQPTAPVTKLMHKHQRWYHIVPNLLNDALQASKRFNNKQHLIA
jgi:hypothetical protein